MASAKEGDKVRVHYTGSLQDGTVFDSSKDRQPLEFTVGEGQVISGFDDAVKGMEEGESKKITISSDEAYGERREDLVVAYERDRLPDDLEPEVGMALQAKAPDGSVTEVMVVDMDEEKLMLDANHPLAGRELQFEIELVEIV